VLIPASPSSASVSSSSFSSVDCRSAHLLVFGGRSNPSHAMHDVALLNLDTYEWLALPPPILGPGVTMENIARFRHTAIWSQHRMVVYGGCKYETHATAATPPAASNSTIAPPAVVGPCTVHTVYNDILVLDTSVSPMRWDRITPAGFADAKLASTTTDGDTAKPHAAASSEGIPSLPHKHTHAAAYCPTSQCMYVVGGYSEANFHRNPTDNALYCLEMTGALSGWSWRRVSATLTGVPPPPLASSTLHVLSSRFLLLLGGVSSEDMYSLSSLWIVDLVQRTWSRPFLHAGPHTRYHPVLERSRALQENKARQRSDDEMALPTIDSMRLAASADPVRIVEHSFICKHAAVFVHWPFMSDGSLTTDVGSSSSTGTSSSPLHLVLCGGGGNVFHFNPFFNPTLVFHIRTRDSVDDVASTQPVVESMVSIGVTDLPIGGLVR
jgi:hypothetical protein